MPFDDPRGTGVRRGEEGPLAGQPAAGHEQQPLMFTRKPTSWSCWACSGSCCRPADPVFGFINVEAAAPRAVVQGVNPCAEILPGNKSFCNLVEVNLAAFDTWNTS